MPFKPLYGIFMSYCHVYGSIFRGLPFGGWVGVVSCIFFFFLDRLILKVSGPYGRPVGNAWTEEDMFYSGKITAINVYEDQGSKNLNGIMVNNLLRSEANLYVNDALCLFGHYYTIRDIVFAC